jgi:DNA polymerase-1
MHEDQTERPLLIVDGDNLAHRAYHSTPKTVRSPAGVPINAIVGFVNMLVAIWTNEQPRGVIVAWDTLSVTTYRHALWPAYQSGRVFDSEILEQLEALPAICAAFGFATAREAGFEADDLMAAAAALEVARGGTCLLLTNDRDAYQLVSDYVTVLSPLRGASLIDRIGPIDVVARMGVLPEQVVAFKALSGDPSDRIPGAKGIGPKTAAALLLKHGTLEKILRGWGRPAEVALIETFRDVVQMRPDVPVTLPPSGTPDWQRASAALREVGALALADRIAQLSVRQDP